MHDPNKVIEEFRIEDWDEITGPGPEPESEPKPEITYESPTLARLPKDQWPKPTPVCVSCPAAVWHTVPGDIRNFCKVLHVIVYSHKEPLELTACDGREMALAALETG